MTKKQLFENLKMCIITRNCTFDTIGRIHYDYEIDGNTFHKLMHDLEQEVEKEEEYKEKIKEFTPISISRCSYLPNVTYVVAYPVKCNIGYTCQVMFNQKTTILKIGNFKTVVKCDNRDKFVPIIGLGIALYRYYRQDKSTKGMIKSLETETKLSHLKLAEYAFNYFSDFNKSKAKKVCELINKYEEGKWIDVCL